MAKSRAQKKEAIDELRARLQSSQTFFVVRPIGITANESSQLKKDTYEFDATYNVVKNNLLKVALKEEKLPELEILDNQEHAIVFVGDQVSEAAKVLSKFAKETDKMEIQGGMLKGSVITGAQVKELADLPSKEQLIGQLLSVFNGPVRGLVTVLNGNVRELVYALNAIAEAKQ